MSLISANPTLSRSKFIAAHPAAGVSTMTLAGTVTKTALSLTVVAATAAVAWTLDLPPLAVLALIVGASAVGMLVTFRPRLAGVLTLPYAAAEGFALGAISGWYADGRIIAGADGAALVWAAAGLSFSVAAALLAFYSTGRIKPTANFKRALYAATSGVTLFYCATILVRLFGFNMPLVHSTSPAGIVFSLVVVAIAAACLVVDFELIEQGVERGAPQHMEWYGAFALTVTMVWLYLELLRLLAKLQSRR